MVSRTKIKGDVLIVDGSSAKFENPIETVLELDDIVVVMLKATGGSYSGKHRNVIGVNGNGEEVWKIDKNPDKLAGQHDSYTGIWEEDGDVWAYNACGMAYRINPGSGEIDDKRLMK